MNRDGRSDMTAARLEIADGLSSVVVLHGGALGDFVLTHNVLACLRCWCPTLRIDVVARSPLAKWVAGRGVIDSALDYESFGIERLFAMSDGTGVSVPDRLRGYDLTLSFLGEAESPPGVAMQRAGLRAICVDPRPIADVLEPTPSLTRHITAQWLHVLSENGLPLADCSPVELRISAEERLSAKTRLETVLGAARRPRVIVHPGSGSRAKCCPVEKFERVVAGLVSAGCNVAWMIGPTELDWYGQEWIAHLGRTAPVVYEEDVTSAASLVVGADSYLGNDAGMTHVAAMAGVKTVALFGPTNANVWRPLGRQVTTIQCDAAFKRPGVSDILRLFTDLDYS